MGQRIIFIEINNAYWWGWLVHVNLGGELNAGSRSRIIDRSEVTSRRDDAIGIEQIHPVVCRSGKDHQGHPPEAARRYNIE